jgi:hypothetical protein
MQNTKMNFQARDYFLPLRLTLRAQSRSSGGARLCPAPRGISRSTSERRTVLNHSNAPDIAKLLRLVSATQPRFGGVPRLAAFAGLRLNV